MSDSFYLRCVEPVSLTSFSFLDDLYRIANRDYEPTDDDVVRARLRTMGVQEYRFVFETGIHHQFVTWFFLLTFD